MERQRQNIQSRRVWMRSEDGDYTWEIQGVPVWLSGLRIWCCHSCGSGCCYGLVSICSPETSTCYGTAKKKKKIEIQIEESTWHSSIFMLNCMKSAKCNWEDQSACPGPDWNKPGLSRGDSFFKKTITTGKLPQPQDLQMSHSATEKGFLFY